MDERSELDRLYGEIEAMKDFGRLPMRRARDDSPLQRLIDGLYSTAKAAVERAERAEAGLHSSLSAELESMRQAVGTANLRMWRARNAKAKAEAQAVRERARADKAAQKAQGRLDVAALGAFEPDGFYVYFLWGDDQEQPLYIGQSANLFQRLASHTANPQRRPHIRRITVTPCADRRQMGTLEMRLIRQHKPPWNVAGVPGRSVKNRRTSDRL